MPASTFQYIMPCTNLTEPLKLGSNGGGGMTRPANRLVDLRVKAAMASAYINAESVCPLNTPGYPPGTQDYDPKSHSNIFKGVSICIIASQESQGQIQWVKLNDNKMKSTPSAPKWTRQRAAAGINNHFQNWKASCQKGRWVGPFWQDTIDLCDSLQDHQILYNFQGTPGWLPRVLIRHWPLVICSWSIQCHMKVVMTTLQLTHWRLSLKRFPGLYVGASARSWIIMAWMVRYPLRFLTWTYPELIQTSTYILVMSSLLISSYARILLVYFSGRTCVVVKQIQSKPVLEFIEMICFIMTFPVLVISYWGYILTCSELNCVFLNTQNMCTTFDYTVLDVIFNSANWSLITFSSYVNENWS